MARALQKMNRSAAYTFNGRFLVNWSERRISSSLEFLFAASQKRLARGDIEDNRIPHGGTPGWKVINLYGGYNLSTVKLNIGIQNLLNEDYRTHGSGVNGVGRSAWIQLGVHF